MNITPSNAASNTGLQPAASGTAQTSTGLAAGGVDVPVDPSSSTAGFGAILTIHLADGRDEYATTNGSVHASRGELDDRDAGPDIDTKATPVGPKAESTILDAATPTPTTPLPALVASSSSTPGSDSLRSVKSDKSDKDASDDAVDGTAAQLAVISQWAAFASPSATVAAPSTTAAGSAPAGNVTTVRTGVDAKSVDRTNGVAKDDDGASKEGVIDGASEQHDRQDVQSAGDRSSAVQDVMQDAMRSFASAGESTTRQDHRSSSSDAPRPVPVATADQAGASSTRESTAKTASDLAIAALGSTATLEQATSPTSNPNATVAIGSLFATRMATAGSTPVATASPTIASTLHETVGTGAWSNEVGQVALKMATTDLQSASLRLNPEHLGPLDVQVRVDNGVTHVAFNAAHADTRQALEASRTTLDQMFSSQGIRMGDVSVGAATADASSGRGPQADGAQTDTARRDGGNRWSAGSSTDDVDASTTVAARVSRTVGLVDTFA